MAEHSTAFDDAVRFRRADDLEEIPTRGRIALYRSDMGKAIVLNPAASLLWQHLETPRTRGELALHLMARFPAIGRSRLEEDVSLFVSELQSRGLIVPAKEP